MPYFDSSGWFLIEKTTILTNSCCLHVQPTFGGGYLRGSAFGSAAEPKVGWFSTPTKKTVQFSRTSLSYRPIAALSTGVDRGPRLIRVFAQIRGEIFAFLGLSPSVIARSRVQILDLAPLYRTVGAALSTGCYVVPRRLSVRRDSITSSTGRRRPPGPLSISLLSPPPYSWRPPACLSRTPDT